MRSRPIAFSPDDRHVLIGSELSAAVLLNAETREVVMSFEGHAKRFLRAAFSPPPNRLVATSSFDNTVKVWDVDVGTCLATFSELGKAVNGVAWSPDGSLLAISSADTIRIFEWSTSELQVTLEGHTKLVTSVAFSPSGELLASSSNDKTVRVWSIDKRSPIAVLAGPSTDVNSVEFSPDGSFLACAADDSVWVWDINPTSIYRVKPPPEHPRDRWRRVARLVGRMQNAARHFMPRAPQE
ncbi:WD40 repeat-like protein [Auricularia subglabra TFB-10046 SS5]|nr:WD40 repeat-like protein [Auricularia subglabra TFB-10046 SS5]